MPALAYVSLGSNIGDSLSNLQQAIRLLDETAGVKVKSVSSVYETDPVGYEDQQVFLNIAAGVETNLSPDELLVRCLEIEQTLGRERVIRWGPRAIDLDVLLYDDEQLETERLTIPHPRMHERSFVLVPLLELNPSLIHPVLHQPFSELLTDTSGVRLFKETERQKPEVFLSL
ncbi:2-amino-4-hydroxy-6-hydroxymethyldihydropteridine diphosphokinase [Jeotgalibacillus sp. R-1-5s-1]|uniref:2-amino-4-hydroxy-6- hydroxymethyldihydropteridine diphosphokinase n=1 Tax=Jeotgalibacillus sp. R-1-5s-1 TaxID=2555897 RepID=UPI00106B7B2E|nr:2-amino-4-hydroxy-6-hydroxymethyldihydropteridine diphosphokinase [Jeotgalibacillus sp. R-1-5s-1]TFE01944.1 2-amino-4-hydroxy-6-hydroxymethyldihydropteridine diphosphokinase [Jeotgalibacillus sp. R-1-5s-1]